MQVRDLEIPAVKLVMPARHGDLRGYLSETFSARALADAGIDGPFVQENHSLSRARGVVRGLHYQCPDKAQGKLVRVVRGAILDVAVDIRRGSPTYGRHVTAVLSAENWMQIWVPVGFAHGFCTLEPDTEVIYKLTDYYAPALERGIAWDDPDLAISWPVGPHAAILSEKDRANPPLARLATPFMY